MKETAREALLTRFHKMKADSDLRDMKFYLGKVSEATVEDVCGEVNRLYDEVAKGNVKEVHSWGDSQRP